jgi:hypothetical protein
MPQDCDQNDDCRDIDPTPEEPQRRWRLSAPAPVDGTAEAEAPVVLGSKATGPTTRLPRISGRMQLAATFDAAFGSARVGNIAIDAQQKLVESAIGQ